MADFKVAPGTPDGTFCVSVVGMIVVKDGVAAFSLGKGPGDYPDMDYVVGGQERNGHTAHWLTNEAFDAQEAWLAEKERVAA